MSSIENSKPYPIDISLVISSFNDAHRLSKTIPEILDYFEKSSYTFELIIVDDGSSDNTEEIINLFNNRVHFLKHSKNQGKGYSIRKGIMSANGKYIFFTDADLPYSMTNIPFFIKYLNDYGMVIGSRGLPGSHYIINQNLLRKIASRIFTIIIGFFIVTGYFDTQCGFKGFTAGTAKKLFSKSRIKGYAFDVEIIYMGLKQKVPIHSLPVICYNENKGSKVRLFRDSFLMLIDIFRIKFYYSMGYYE